MQYLTGAVQHVLRGLERTAWSTLLQTGQDPYTKFGRQAPFGGKFGGKAPFIESRSITRAFSFKEQQFHLRSS